MEAVAKPRLGRGLNALIGEMGSQSENESNTPGPVAALATDRIQPNPYQPRKQFDDEELNGLVESIRVHGILQPLVVRVSGDGYQLIAGERRLRAAQVVGLAEVPVHVMAFEDQQMFEAALVENIQRSDLNPIEKAQGFKDYLEKFGMTQEQLGSKLGLDRTSISNLLGLLNLAGEVQDAVRNGQITLGHAKILKGINDQDRQVSLCRETIMKKYSVHALEEVVKQQRLEAIAAAVATPESTRAEPAEKTAHVKSLEDELRQHLAVKIEIRVKAKDKGQIVIGFDTNDDFERILAALKR